MIYYKDGVKMMRPVCTREEYMGLRNGGFQKENVARIRQGDEAVKASLVQMNYSCLPNDDGTLKGAKRMSTTVGMDVDWTPSPLPHEGEEQIAARKEEWLKKVPEMVLSKKDALGLLMLERSASKGFHLVFRRREELSQEDNLRWASDLLGVEYDKGAKDITRVFFTTTEAELIYLDDAIFRPTPAVAALQCCSSQVAVPQTSAVSPQPSFDPEARYNGVLFKDIIAKYWELFNDGKEPVEGDRNALTFELAVTIRSICGYSLEKMMQGR